MTVQAYAYSSSSQFFGTLKAKFKKNVRNAFFLKDNKFSQGTLERARRFRTTFTQQSPIGYNGTPQIHIKTALSLPRSPPHLITHPSTDPTHHPKRSRGPISRFATIHFLDTQTDRQTDTLYKRQVYFESAYAYEAYLTSHRSTTKISTNTSR